APALLLLIPKEARLPSRVKNLSVRTLVEIAVARIGATIVVLGIIQFTFQVAKPLIP
ncbi:MAG: hypothetical protein GTN90_08015, partial [Xanthomonadales bacterium]|nr:hypothetical protein [Xanthomonadales bacterium]